MADHTMMRFCTLGLSILFERQEPDLDKPIYRHIIELKKVGITEGKVSKLAKCMAGEDGVLTSDDIVNEAIDDVYHNGAFTVYVEETYRSQFMEKYKNHQLLEDMHCYPWDVMSRGILSEKFPDLFEGRHFCPECDKEKKEATDPCENGECSMGLCNFREMQEKLQQTVNSMNQDVVTLSMGAPSLVEAVEAETPAQFVGYECPCCSEDYGPGMQLDMDDEFECGNCGTWVGAEDKLYE